MFRGMGGGGGAGRVWGLPVRTTWRNAYIMGFRVKNNSPGLPGTGRGRA